MVQLQSRSLRKKQLALSDLAVTQEVERLRFAARSSGVVMFDWTVADDRVHWEGAVDIFPFFQDSDCRDRGRYFLEWLNPDSRPFLTAVLESEAEHVSTFDLDLEATSTLGPVCIIFVGTRFPGEGGGTERITGALRIATERQREAKRLTYLATRDELTGHLNRNSLRAELAEAIEHAARNDSTCAFIVASIDRLAVVNDGYGFDVGDEVIVAVGRRLSSALRSTDMIGRTAGNKFGVILRNCSEPEITVVSERLRALVRSEAIDTKAGQVSATCSVGAVWLPTHASSSQEAMLRAEEALDRARSAGRNGFAVYRRSQQRETARLRLMGIADEVVSALNDDRLTLAYQPIVSAKDRKPVHYEGLVRMVRPDGSLATAGQFIPAAEQLGLIRLVDRRVLELTISELIAHPELSLAVNVSGTTAADPAWLASFIDHVRANHKVAPRMLVELTETASLHYFEENAKFISQLRGLGCRVAIDDFGAGYTSFRNLQMLRIDMVKIDGSFVSDLSISPENQVFVRTLVELAKNFDLKTVAEWVTSEEDAALLESFGVDYFQGFHFGEPALGSPWKSPTEPKA
ncbi:MAG: bifunctional diguanylate cyclase/phosphodiesterase [Alphaproteobacteria bacterium]|nr:bifunctional diguanylate cyclase/phosphodiesterase [Alphaproteobacteria bacterium]